MKKKYQLEKEFADKWITALRSGRYKQTTGVLKSSNKGYCCLGLACKISGISYRIILNKNLIDEQFLSKKYVQMVPELLRGLMLSGTFVEDVATMNDGGDSFTDIADWLEQNVELI